MLLLELRDENIICEKSLAIAFVQKAKTIVERI